MIQFPMISKGKVIMAKGVALWLKINTSITVGQISRFCELDALMIDSLNHNILQPHNPIKSGQLTKEEILKAENDHTHDLKSCLNIVNVLPNKSTRKYIPLMFKNRKHSIILWFYQQLTDEQKKNKDIIMKIAKSISSTIAFVEKNIKEIQDDPKYAGEALNPLTVNICSEEEVRNIFNPIKK